MFISYTTFSIEHILPAIYMTRQILFLSEYQIEADRLFEAAEKGDVETVKKLTESVSDINCRTKVIFMLQ